MSAVTVAEIKSILKLTDSSDDALIESNIASAYARIRKKTGYRPDDGERLSNWDEVMYLDDDYYIRTRGTAQDIELKKFTLDGEEIDILENLTAVDVDKWKLADSIASEGERYYIEYVSADISALLRHIVTQIIIFELKKYPGFDNLINKRKLKVDDIYSQEYITDYEFYRSIDRELAGLFPRGGA